MNLKADIRIATGKQFEYTSWFVGGDLEAIRGQERAIRASYEEPEPCLPRDEWNPIVDAALANTLKLSPDAWERMSPFQQEFLQTIKRSRNRM